MTSFGLVNREQVRAAITPILGYPVDNTDLRWPRGYAAYGWDSSGFGVFRACCSAVQLAGDTPARKVREEVRGAEVRMWAGTPGGMRTKWLAKHHPDPTTGHLRTLALVVDSSHEWLRGPLEHGFVLGWDRPVSSAWSCCPLVEDQLHHIFGIIRRTNSDQHFSHK